MSSKHFDDDADMFIFKLKSEGIIDEAVFSLLIGTGDRQSKMTLGGFRDDFFEGQISWHQINPSSVYWQVRLSDFKIPLDTQEEIIIFDKQVDVIVDSGTSFFLMPE